MKSESTNILHLTWQDINGTYGGIQSMAQSLFRNLEERGIHNVYRILPAGNFSLIRTSLSRTHLSLYALEEEVEALIANEQIHVVNTHNIHQAIGPGVGEEIVRIIERLSLPHVATVHDLVDNVPTWEISRQKRILASATCVAASSFIADQLSKVLQIKCSNVIELGIEFPDEADLLPPTSSDLVVCSPARLLPQKGLLEAVIISGHLGRLFGSVTLRLSNKRGAHNGAGQPFIQEIERVASHFPHLNLEFFEGDAAYPRIYQDSHLTLCLPKIVEGFGLIPLESLASGRPVIATPTGGMAWVLDFEGVISIASGSLVQIAQAARDVLEHWPEWHQRVRDERRVLMDRFEDRLMADRYKELYEMLVQG